MPDASIGHNQPPSPIEALIQDLRDQNRDLIERADELRGGLDRCIVTDDESAGKAQLLAEMAHKAAKLGEERQKEAKRPHAELAAAAFDFFKPALTTLSEVKRAALNRLDSYKDEQRRLAEAARRKLEEEARQQREEAERLAAQATSETDLDTAIAIEEAAVETEALAQTIAPAEIRSTYGHASPVQKTYDFRITDPDKIPRPYLMVNDSAIKAAIRAAVKAGMAPRIDGIEFTERRQSRVTGR